MTKEEKQLLLNDLCARLPYGVIVKSTWKEKISDESCDGDIGKLTITKLELLEEDEYSDIKPYLRPISSMTDKERKAFDNFCVIDEFAWEGNIEIGYKNQANIMSKGIEWLLEHHFDFRGLIEKGLALEAPKGMYKTE